MGNQVNSNDGEPKDKMLTSPNQNGHDPYLFLSRKDSMSSYKGVKTDTSEAGRDEKSKQTTSHSTIKSTNIEDKSISSDKKSKIEKVFFQWTEGGSIVYVTGNFSNWTQWFIMNKNGQNFDIVLVTRYINFRNCRKVPTNINSSSITCGGFLNTILLSVTKRAILTTS